MIIMTFNPTMQDVIAQIKSNPDLLSESLDEIVKKDPQLLKQLLLQVLPHIIDKMEQQNEIVGGAAREKRGLWIQDGVKPQSRTCNTLAKINSYYQIFIKFSFYLKLRLFISFLLQFSLEQRVRKR